MFESPRVMGRLENHRLGQASLMLSIFLYIYEYWLNSYFPLADSPLPLALLLISVILLEKKKLRLNKPILYLMIFLFLSLVSAIVSAASGISYFLNLAGFLIYFQFVLAIL